MPVGLRLSLERVTTATNHCGLSVWWIPGFMCEFSVVLV